MPIALGTHMLVEVPKLSKKSKGGIILDDSTINREQMGLNVGRVISLGEEAFRDRTVKPQVGDMVFFIAYAGDKIPSSKDSNIRLIYDEHCRAIVQEGDLDGMDISFEE